MKLTAKCTNRKCKNRWAMTAAQIAEAQEFGVATCPKCHSIATVVKVEGQARPGS